MKSFPNNICTSAARKSSIFSYQTKAKNLDIGPDWRGGNRRMKFSFNTNKISGYRHVSANQPTTKTTFVASAFQPLSNPITNTYH